MYHHYKRRNLIIFFTLELRRVTSRELRSTELRTVSESGPKHLSGPGQIGFSGFVQDKDLNSFISDLTWRTLFFSKPGSGLMKTNWSEPVLNWHFHFFAKIIVILYNRQYKKKDTPYINSPQIIV